MNKLLIILLVSLLALQIHKATASNNCPVQANYLIAQTLRASDIHREFLDKGWSKDRDWDQFWMITHLETANALSQATVGCK